MHFSLLASGLCTFMTIRQILQFGQFDLGHNFCIVLIEVDDGCHVHLDRS
jgi:hypothetical protein